MQDPASVYWQLINEHEKALRLLLVKKNRLGWARFTVFVFTVAIAYFVFVQAGAWGFVPVLTGIGCLLWLVSLDADNHRRIANTRTLIAINRDELDVLDHRFTQRYDGSEYATGVDHDYANDLDLFGPASLYQWCHRCFTEVGRKKLARDLLHPWSEDMILDRQEAVREIAAEVKWRQQLQASAMQTTLTTTTEKRLDNWLQQEEKHFTAPAWRLFVNAYSLITVASAAAAITGYIPATVFSFLFLLYFITALVLSRNTIGPYTELSRIVKEMATLQELIEHIECRPPSSVLLRRMQAAVSDKGRAATAIKRLKTILDRFDLRLNIFGLLFLNSFLLWDVRQMMALNSWRGQYRRRVPAWFALIAEAEVLNSLATLHYNQPSWCFPTLVEDHFVFRGKSLGHPLLPATVRVTSDFSLSGKAKIALVTGSNMAGKSTFLRSLGVNTVLAQMGAPVCAAALTLSPVRLMSSMRIADNLAENTSTFYAELKKLKTIIEAVNRREQVFVLLDEILRGTNSFDRHAGSAALIAQLIRQQAVAVIATHDVELAGLETEYPGSIENYHFDVQVEGERLYFDYRLKAGVCTSMNASILMKQIGIEL